MVTQRNVLGEVLEPCSFEPMTGYYRDGCCSSGTDDSGAHVVCAIMNDEFLRFSKNKGNDLTTPQPGFSFPGLRAGDRWCICALRWIEAVSAGVIAKIDLNATHESILKYVSLETLVLYSISCESNKKSDGE